jgi:hypothetical protein
VLLCSIQIGIGVRTTQFAVGRSALRGKRGWRVRAEHAKNSLRVPALSSKYCRFKRKKGAAGCCDSKRKETNDLVLVVVGT